MRIFPVVLVGKCTEWIAELVSCSQDALLAGFLNPILCLFYTTALDLRYT